MATTFRVELDHKKMRDGRYCVYVRICQDRHYKRYKTTVSLSRKSDWNPKGKHGAWVRPSDPDSMSKNALLQAELDSILDTYVDERANGAVSIEKLAVDRKNADISPRFLPYAEKVSEEIKATGHIRNAKKYTNFCNKLRAYSPRVTFADIDTAFLKKFETYLLQLPNARVKDQRLSVNAVYVEMKIFRALLNRARIVDGLIKDNPFSNYHLKQEKTSKDKLTREEINAIVTLQLEEGSIKWHTRNAFLLSYYCAGIRAGDIIQLRWSNVSKDGRISYQMDKNGKIRDLVMVRQAKEIIDLYNKGEQKASDYIFPLLPNDAPWAKYVTYEQKKVMPVDLLEKMLNKVSSVNAVFNKNLKRIAEDAGIEKHVTFHVSRHTFATMALQENIDSMTIKGALAHSSLQTTETYLQEFNMSAIDTTLQRVFDQKPDINKLIEQIKLLSAEEQEQLFTKVMPNESGSRTVV